MRTLTQASIEVDRRARTLARELHLRDGDLESYQFCCRAVLRENPVLAHDYTGRGDVNTSEIRGLLRRLAELNARLSGGRLSVEEALQNLLQRYGELLVWEVV